MSSLSLFALYSMVSLFGIGDTSDAHLAILISQTAKEIAELEKLLKAANLTSEEIAKTRELLENAQEGYDKVLKPYNQSRKFAKSLIGIKDGHSLSTLRYSAEEARDYFETYKRFFPEKAKADEEALKEHAAFQTNIKKANEADLSDIESIENHLKNAAPGEVPKLQSQIQLKNLESQVLVREQMGRILEENKSLREELVRNRRESEIENAASLKEIESSWKTRWEPNFYD